MSMIKHRLTIVIPSKNEEDIIDITLHHLNKQFGIKGTRVIIADCSTDNTRDIILSSKFKHLNIEIIDGGLPSIARNNGAKLATTDYVLFLDADIFLTDTFTIYNTLKEIKANRYQLVTTKFRVKGKYSFIFPVFEFFRNLVITKSPCAIGGYMLFDLQKFNNLGGFNENDKFAEDFHLSMKISIHRFFVSNHKIYTTDRRFRNKGLWYMMKMSFLSYINRNNDTFFSDDHNYWI